MPTFADGLGLHGHEREQFIQSAWEAWTPPVVWKRLAALEAKPYEPREPTKLEQDLAVCRSVVSNLIDILLDVEALFYARTVPMHKIREKRDQLGLSVRRAIEQYSTPG